jgi:hypothetical protein
MRDREKIQKKKQRRKLVRSEAGIAGDGERWRRRDKVE